MTASPDALLTAALALPPEDRAALAEKLLASLGGEDHFDLDPDWAEEIERRIQEFDQGFSKGIPAEEVMRSLSIRKKKS